MKNDLHSCKTSDHGNVSEDSPTKNWGESSDTEAIHAHFCPNFQPIYHYHHNGQFPSLGACDVDVDVLHRQPVNDPLALIPHPALGPIVHDTFIPSIAGGLNSTALLTIIAIVGTTVAPWQLFF